MTFLSKLYATGVPRMLDREVKWLCSPKSDPYQIVFEDSQVGPLAAKGGLSEELRGRGSVCCRRLTQQQGQ